MKKYMIENKKYIVNTNIYYLSLTNIVPYFY